MDGVGILKKEFVKIESKHKELEEGLSNVDDLIGAVDNNQVNRYFLCVLFRITNFMLDRALKVFYFSIVYDLTHFPLDQIAGHIKDIYPKL